MAAAVAIMATDRDRLSNSHHWIIINLRAGITNFDNDDRHDASQHGDLDDRSHRSRSAIDNCA